MPTRYARKQRAERTYRDSVRGWGNVLGIWRLCGNATCGRARLCRGEGEKCFGENYRRLPEGVRAWFEALGEAQKQGCTFDQAMVWLEGRRLTKAFTNWCAAVERNAKRAGQGSGQRRIASRP